MNEPKWVTDYWNQIPAYWYKKSVLRKKRKVAEVFPKEDENELVAKNLITLPADSSKTSQETQNNRQNGKGD